MSEQSDTPRFLRGLLSILIPLGAIAGGYFGYADSDLVSGAIGAIAGAFAGAIAAHVVNMVTNLAFSVLGVIGPLLILAGIVYVAYQRAN